LLHVTVIQSWPWGIADELVAGGKGWGVAALLIDAYGDEGRVKGIAGRHDLGTEAGRC
jgi:hypothetical protein